MIKFLVDRPIAVLMTFTALLALGWVSYTYLPVSLMPDVAIPEITVHYSYPYSSARELENAVTAPLRRQLLQVGHLDDIRSETRDGTGVLHLRFKYGINTHYAFIEVNEKIDAAMYSLPRDMERPRVLKASATDIPVFFLNVSLRTNTANKGVNPLAGYAASPSPVESTVTKLNMLLFIFLIFTVFSFSWIMSSFPLSVRYQMLADLFQQHIHIFPEISCRKRAPSYPKILCY
jgi:hypothetical protein